jgi:DNA repair exonuclease SbcCD ATPase subunit
MCSVNTELREHIIELQEQLKRVLSSQLTSLTDELELVQTESTDWKQRTFLFQALQAENDRLRDRVIELEAQRLDVDDIPAKGRRLAGIIESIDRDSSGDEGVELTQRILALEKEVEQKGQLVAQLTAERERLITADFYTETAVLTQERNELEAELRRLQTLKDDVAESLEEQVDYLQSTLETLISEKEELEERVEQQEQMMATMQELLSADQTAVKGKLQAVAEFLAVFKQSQDDNKRLEAELRNVRRELHAVAQENRGLKASLDL